MIGVVNSPEYETYSPEGQIAKRELGRGIDHQWLTARRALAASSLLTAISETQHDDWDGYGAAAVNFNSSKKAWLFLQILPSTVPVPDIGVDTDGEISMEWYVDPRRVLSVSIGDNNLVSYASIQGPEQHHGSAYFLDSLPEIVVQQLHSLYKS